MAGPGGGGRGLFSDTAAAGSSMSRSLCGAGSLGGRKPSCLLGRWWGHGCPEAGVRLLVGRLGPTAEGWGPSAGGRGWVCSYSRSLGGWAWPGDSGLMSWSRDYRMVLAAGRAPRGSDATVSPQGVFQLTSSPEDSAGSAVGLRLSQRCFARELKVHPVRAVCLFPTALWDA